MNFIIIIGYFMVITQTGLSLIIERSSDPDSVYSSLKSHENGDHKETNNSNASKNILEFVTHSKYKIPNDGKDKFGVEEMQFAGKGRGITIDGSNASFVDSSNVTHGLLAVQHERCLRSEGFFDCLKFKIFKFLRDLFQSETTKNLSEINGSQLMGDNKFLFVKLPPTHRKMQPILTQSMRKAIGRSYAADVFEFLIEQLEDFFSKHGLIINVNDVQGNQDLQLDLPWLIVPQSTAVERISRKVKKKEMAIVFPMLVLFKFLKIKLLLVPILIGVLFLKKLLILTLTLLPYLVGLFGCCRRPPFFGPLQSTGILQEVDTRGEFSSNFGYSFPSREGFAFRHRDKRPSEGYSDY